MNEEQKDIDIEEELEFAPFFIRILALCIDGLIIGLFGYILGLIFNDFFVQLTWKARFVGIIISLLYYSILNSKINNGQTLGKLILNIKVIKKDGACISFPKSLLRTFILLLFFFLNGWALPILLDFNILKVIYSFIFITPIILIIYFYIFNRKTRQSLHDLAVGTYVIKNNDPKTYNFQIINKIHIYIAIILTIIILITTSFIPLLSKKPIFNDLLDIQRKVSNIEDLYNTSVFNNKATFSMKGTTQISNNIIVVSYIKNKNLDKDFLSNQIAKIVLDNSLSENIDYIIIRIVYGFDIGIAKKWNSNNYKYKKEEWIEKLK